MKAFPALSPATLHTNGSGVLVRIFLPGARRIWPSLVKRARSKRPCIKSAPSSCTHDCAGRPIVLGSGVGVGLGVGFSVGVVGGVSGGLAGGGTVAPLPGGGGTVMSFCCASGFFSCR